ncbi:hypothetical protein DPMN_047531 [Dreissena polymorpha]|uniref:Uncharacterized protein n=1 Tax=Dreissena polymorpha TaxID=45954 RepID=A0A9D4D9V9_DREPO|nr:hypothetical protein DPMN_047531 [Dreissena polymorpha]
MLKQAELARIVPLETADCERSCSTQNDIKTSDRNRLSADRLNTLLRIAINKASVADFDNERAVGAWRVQTTGGLYLSSDFFSVRGASEEMFISR